MTPETFGSIGELESFQYQLTSDAQWWLTWIGYRYEVAKYLEENTNSDGILCIDCFGGELRDALEAEGIDRLPCLDKTTTLFQITFHLTH